MAPVTLTSWIHALLKFPFLESGLELAACFYGAIYSKCEEDVNSEIRLQKTGTSIFLSLSLASSDGVGRHVVV